MTTFNDTHRWTYALLAACVFFFLFQATITAQPPDESAEESANSPVNIPDSALRGALEKALGKTAGEDITQAEMATVTSLVASRAGISDLTGLAYATQLTTLILSGNPIADLSPLETLTQLQTLHMKNCWITDISSLQGLRRLRWVELSNNLITDVSPLLHLPAPISFQLNGNPISDVSAFQQATTPVLVLALTKCQIVDVSPLAAFIRQVGSLHLLALSDNPITDFSPFSGLTLHTYDFEIPPESTEESIDIPDPIFRKDIVRTLRKPIDAPLTVADLEQLETLNTSGTDFTGLEHAVNLKALTIYTWGGSLMSVL